MLYLETPVGVGFSYSIDTTGYDAVSDAVTGIFMQETELCYFNYEKITQ